MRIAITATNANRPKGAVEDDDHYWQIGANDQARAAADYAPLVLRYRNGNAVRLADVAEVADSVQDVRNYGVANGKPAILLQVYKQPGANIIEAVDRVRALLPQLQASIPAAIDVQIVSDRTPTHPRLAARGGARARHRRGAGDPGGVPVPAQRARHADPERGGAGVAGRHLRRHVPARATRSTTCR